MEAVTVVFAIVASGFGIIGAIYGLVAMIRHSPGLRFIAFGLIAAAGLFALTGCSSLMTTYGFRTLDTHYGKECEKLGYTKLTDEWRECIMEHRRTRPGVYSQ